MAENKKSVLLHCDIIHTIEKMDDKTAGEFFKHYLRYVNDLNPSTDNLIVEIAFEPVKQSLKRDLRKWESRSARSKENGKLGGRPKAQEPKKPTGLITKPKKPTRLSKKTEIPTLEEFIAHAVERKPNVSPDDVTLKYYAWVDNDWSITRKDGIHKIQNWKSTLTNTVKYLKERYKQPEEPIVETLEQRIKRLNNEAKAQG